MVSWRGFYPLFWLSTVLMLLLPSVSPLVTNSATTRAIAQENKSNLAYRLASSYLRKLPITNIPDNLTLKQAEKIQDEFVDYLRPTLGNIVGYKAGLTNEIVQKRFQVSEPVRGVLLSKMLLDNGATVPANFGTYPMLEGDLMVRVGRDSINRAKTPEEVLPCLDAVIPFLELPDLVYSQKVPLNGAKIVAVNVGARLGIIGKPIPLKPTLEWQKRLSNIELVISDDQGKILAKGESKALLGDPLKVVLWLKDSLNAQGKQLKKGDLLSLGTITTMLSVQPNTTVKATYFGLESPEPVVISVHFTLSPIQSK